MAKLKVLIIGCGRVATKHLKAIKKLNKDLELVGVTDINEEAAKKITEGTTAKIYKDYKLAIEELKPDIVAVTVPSGLHYQIADFAMNNGANLLLEKPMTMGTEEAKKIWEKSKETGRKVAMGHIYRYFPIVAELQKDISLGMYGKVTHGTVFVRWGHGEDYYGQAAWRGTWKSDGGAFMNQTIHGIDLLTWLMGSEPEECQAMLAKRLRNIEAEDLGFATLKLENGALANIEGTTATNPKNHEALFSVFCEKADLSIGIKNGKPQLKLRDERGRSLNGKYIRKQLKVGGINSFLYALNPHTGIYADLVKAIREDKNPLADAYAGYSSVDTMMGIYKSAKEAKAISLPLKEHFQTTDMTGFFDDKN